MRKKIIAVNEDCDSITTGWGAGRILNYTVRYRKVTQYLDLIKYHVKKRVGKSGTSPLILNLDARWTLVVSFTPWLLYRMEINSRYHLDSRASSNRAGLDAVKKSFLPLSGLESRFLGDPAVI
jgi:hypothetical protein